MTVHACLRRCVMRFQVRVFQLAEFLLEYTGVKDDDVAAVVAATKAQADLGFT